MSTRPYDLRPRVQARIVDSVNQPGGLSLRGLEGEKGLKSALIAAGFKQGDVVVIVLAPAGAQSS